MFDWPDSTIIQEIMLFKQFCCEGEDSLLKSICPTNGGNHDPADGLSCLVESLMTHELLDIGNQVKRMRSRLEMLLYAHRFQIYIKYLLLECD